MDDAPQPGPDEAAVKAMVEVARTMGEEPEEVGLALHGGILYHGDKVVGKVLGGEVFLVDHSAARSASACGTTSRPSPIPGRNV